MVYGEGEQHGEILGMSSLRGGLAIVLQDVP